MKKIEIEQSSKAMSSSHSGLALIGTLVNEYTTLCKKANKAVGRPNIALANGLKTFIGLLAMGKSDFEAAAGVAGDEWFKEALGIGIVPSEETLRQRMDRHAAAFQEIVEEATVEVVGKTGVCTTELPTGHVAVDIDVFCLDNSNTKKEGVSRTSQGDDGYAPIGASVGQEGWCVGLQLREGRHHSQKGFVPFLRHVLKRARRLTTIAFLVRLDAAHDAAETRAELAGRQDLDFIIKWNPRRANPLRWAYKVLKEGRVWEPRRGKKVGLWTVWISQRRDGMRIPLRLVVRVSMRTSDARGHMLMQPQVDLEGWWTSLEGSEEEIIALYENRGLSEQFHSELKTDLDLERLPWGKCATKALVLSLGGLVDNMLRIVGQNGLLAEDSPVHHKAKRQRICTVIQELITLVARVIRTGRRLKLQFGRHCSKYPAFQRVYEAFNPA